MTKIYIDNKFTKYKYTFFRETPNATQRLRQDNLCTAIIIDIGVIVRSRSVINTGEV